MPYELLTIEQIDDLLEQVGIDLVPPDLDRKKLKQEIQDAGTRYRSRNLSGSDSTANKHAEWLTRTKSLTAKLQAALNDDDNAQWFNVKAPAYFSKAEDERISYGGLKAALDGLHDEVSKQLSGRVLNAYELERSPFEYLAGDRLPEIFSNHFKRKTGVSRAADSGRPQGPLLRFVRGGLDLLKITNNGKRYGDETILKAIRDTKSRPSRRKKSTSGQKL